MKFPRRRPEPAAKPAKFNPKAFGANQPKCPKCNKTVYFAERVVGLNGTEWHKGCMRCNGCEKTLGSVADITDHKGEPYCKVCYAKNFGPKGTGRAGGGDDLSHGRRLLPRNVHICITHKIGLLAVDVKPSTRGARRDDVLRRVHGVSGRDGCHALGV